MNEWCLSALRDDVLGDILAAIGVASILRDDGTVAWRNGRPILRSGLDASAVDIAIRGGIAVLVEDGRAIWELRKPHRRGKKTESLISTQDLAALMNSARPSLRELAIAIFSSCRPEADKSRAMMAKTRFDESLRHDRINTSYVLGEWVSFLDEMSSPNNLDDWDVRLGNTAKSRDIELRAPDMSGQTALNHNAYVADGCIAPTKLRVRAEHPFVQSLAIEGLKALPVKANGHSLMLPQQRRIGKDNKRFIPWRMPIWDEPLNYFQIEQMLSQTDASLTGRGVSGIREFRIVGSGNGKRIESGPLHRVL